MVDGRNVYRHSFVGLQGSGLQKLRLPFREPLYLGLCDTYLGVIFPDFQRGRAPQSFRALEPYFPQFQCLHLICSRHGWDPGTHSRSFVKGVGSLNRKKPEGVATVVHSAVPTHQWQQAQPLGVIQQSFRFRVRE